MSGTDAPETFCIDPLITGLIDAIRRLCNIRCLLYAMKARGTPSPNVMAIFQQARSLSRQVVALSLRVSAEVSDIADGPALHAAVCKYAEKIQFGDNWLRLQEQERDGCDEPLARLESLEAIRWPEVAAARARWKARASKRLDDFLDSENANSGMPALDALISEDSAGYADFRREVEAIMKPKRSGTSTQRGETREARRNDANTVPVAMARPIRVAIAAHALNMRSDLLLKRLRVRGYPIGGIKGSYEAECEHIAQSVGSRRRQFNKWADANYPPLNP